MLILEILVIASLVAWLVLLLGRGFFWRIMPRLEAPASAGCARRPSVAAVIPARNEADILPSTLPSVLAQVYDGKLTVTLVDDRSEDGTSAVAEAAARANAAHQLTVLRGAALPAGWSGKVWALAQGVAQATQAYKPDYLWFTDADIAHAPWVLEALVDRAERDPRDLVSVMALLRADTWWDRLLIPAFVYFFAKLYPFRRVNDPRRRTAGAAGGCVLVRRSALERAGGLAAMRVALIDDCALGRLIQRSGGRLWLSFSRGVRSVRPYGTLSSVWDMVARSAYDQLRYSPLLLVGAVVGMLFLYALGPAACLGGLAATALGAPGGLALAGLGASVWLVMAASFMPMLRHHGVSRAHAPLLPLAGILYTAMTGSSAWRHARGRGGAWKGRTHNASGSPPAAP